VHDQKRSADYDNISPNQQENLDHPAEIGDMYDEVRGIKNNRVDQQDKYFH